MAVPVSPASPPNIPSPCSFLDLRYILRILCLFLCSGCSLCLEYPLAVLCLATPLRAGLGVTPAELAHSSPGSTWHWAYHTVTRTWTWLTPAISILSSGPCTERAPGNIGGAEPVPRTPLSPQVLEVGPCSGIRQRAQCVGHGCA